MILLILYFIIQVDTTIKVYRIGNKTVKIVKEPIKRYKNTPKRKIIYTYPSKSIFLKTNRKGIIIK